MPKNEQAKEVISQIISRESLELKNFFRNLEDNDFDLKPYNEILIEKAKAALWPLDLHMIIEILLKQETDKHILEQILNNKKSIWDKGQWSQEFWKLIKVNNLSIMHDQPYTVNEKGEKAYDLKLYIEQKIKNNELGSNPLLQIDYNITQYTSGGLLNILSELNIKDIQIIPKDQAISLFGQRGIDGMIKVLTRQRLQ